MPRPVFSPDTGISEFLPLSTHVAPAVIKTREGDFMLTWRLQGLPFVGHEDRELEHRHATLNRLLQSLRAPDFTNVAFWTHDIRRRRHIKDASGFKQVFNRRFSQAYFNALSSKKLMQNELYLTVLYRPVVSGKRFAEKSADLERLRAQQQQAIDTLLELAGNVEAVIKDYAPTRLGLYESAHGGVFSEALEFFGYLLNRLDEPVPALHAPIYRYLPVSRQRFSARSGDYVITTPAGVNHFGAMLSIKEYPEGTWPGILNELKFQDFEYVLSHSFSPVGRHDALKALERTKGMMISSGDKAVSQIGELDQAMDHLASGNFVLGQYHLSLAVYGATQEQLAQNLAIARAELSNAGFVSVKEELAVTAAFYAQFPANWQYRTRLANLSSLNFLGLAPLHNFASGKKDRNPWGPCITTLQTTNGQPFFFNFHATGAGEDSLGEKVLGNTMVIGKSGTGKTALINFLLSQAQKLEPAPTIFFFDKDRGAEIFVRACGGNYLALENGVPTGFNPLQCDKNEANAHFLCTLVRMMAGKSSYSPREQEEIAAAVNGTLDMPERLRGMSSLRNSLPNTSDESIYNRIARWCGDGALGWVFDNPRDTIDLQKAPIIGFDYTDLIDNPEVRAPVVSYLLHRLEALIDGRRLIYVMDEFWKILDGGGDLKDFAKNKQKTIRKQNGLGIFATQSPEDALSSDIAPALIEQTATTILLPNPNASREDYVEGLKLTEAEFKIVASMDERSRQFLIKQGHDSNVCLLDLKGMDDELAVISASTDNIEILHEILQEQAQAQGVQINELRPEQWLPQFYERRKGSGKGEQAHKDDADKIKKAPRKHDRPSANAQNADGAQPSAPQASPAPAPDYRSGQGSAPMAGQTSLNQESNVNLKQAAAVTALGVAAAGTAAVSSCNHFLGVHEQFVKVKFNPHPRQRYDLTLTIQDAPGPFDEVSGYALYKVSNRDCVPENNPLEGVRIAPKEHTAIELKRVSDNIYTGTVYLDLIQDENYYGLGMCRWEMVAAVIRLKAGEVTFSPDMMTNEIVEQKTQTQYFAKQLYGQTDIKNFHDAGSGLTDWIAKQQDKYFSTTLTTKENS